MVIFLGPDTADEIDITEPATPRSQTMERLEESRIKTKR